MSHSGQTYLTILTQITVGLTKRSRPTGLLWSWVTIAAGCCERWGSDEGMSSEVRHIWVTYWPTQQFPPNFSMGQLGMTKYSRCLHRSLQSALAPRMMVISSVYIKPYQNMRRKKLLNHPQVILQKCYYSTWRWIAFQGSCVYACSYLIPLAWKFT